MTYPPGTRVTAGGQTGTIEDFATDSAFYGALLGYHVLWDDGSWTLEHPDAIDVVEEA